MSELKFDRESKYWGLEGWVSLAFVFLFGLAKSAMFEAGVLALFVLFGPVWISKLWRSRRVARLVFLLFLFFIPFGFVLRKIGRSEGLQYGNGWQSVLELLLVAAFMIPLMNWAREYWSIQGVASVFALGELLSSIFLGISSDPDYIKYNLAWPVCVLAMAWASVGHPRARVWVAGCVCLFVAVISEYRFLILITGAVLVLSIGVGKAGTGLIGKWVRIAFVLLSCVVGVYLIQLVLLSGLLGRYIASKTASQMVTGGGSLLLGGRVESPAIVALVAARPIGYGFGFLPSSTEQQIIYSAMEGASGTVDQYYVNSYMLGEGLLKVHSIAGDLWVNLGILGLCLAGVLVFWVGCLFSRVIWNRRSPLVVLLVGWTIWDLFFSPLYSNLVVAILSLSLCSSEVESRLSPRSDLVLGSVLDKEI